MYVYFTGGKQVAQDWCSQGLLTCRLEFEPVLPLSTVTQFASPGPHSCPRALGEIEGSPLAGHRLGYSWPSQHPLRRQHALCLVEKVAPT